MAIEHYLLFLLIISEYIVAIRFKGNKYFYFFLLLCSIEPVTIALGEVFHEPSLWRRVYHLTSISILLALPELKWKYRIPVFLSVILYNFLDSSKIALFIQIIMVSSFIILYFLEQIYKELVIAKSISIFMFAMIFYFGIVSFGFYFFYTIPEFYFASHIARVILFILIVLSVAVVGPNKKIKVNLRIFDKFLRLKEESEIINGPLILLEKSKNELTERELAIYKLLAENFRNDEIAEKLFIEKKTVQNHLNNIKDKLGFKSLVELRKAIKKHPHQI